MTNSSLSISTLQEAIKRLSDSRDRFDISKAVFMQNGIKLMQDSRMKNYNFQSYSSITKCIEAICKVGSAIEKGAVADSFDFQSLMTLPELKTATNIDNAVEWLMAQMTELAVYYGTTISGDVEYLAWDLFNTYGGFSVLDFIKFFAMCKKREFMTDYEHVKVQGISPDFILKWIAKYEDKRSAAIDGLIRDANGNADKRSNTGLTVSTIVQAIHTPKEMEELERVASDMRRDFTLSLHDKVTFNYSVGTDVIPIESEYISEKKAGLFLFDFVFNFIAFDEQKAKNIVKHLSESMTSTYNSSNEESLLYLKSQGVVLSEYKRQQAIQFVLSGQRKLTGLMAIGLLEKSIDESGKKEVLQNLGFNEKFENYNTRSFVKALTRGFESSYYQYLQKSIECNSAPLEVHLYIIQQALIFLKNHGITRPFAEYDCFGDTPQ